MNILKINGTALTGIYVDAAVSFNKPAKRVETFSVPGRNGDLVIDEGTFDNVLISYPVYEKATFPDEFDAIVNWLASLQGYQRIECSNDPNHYRLGRFVVPQTPTAKRLNKDGYYTLTFDCKPQRWLLSGEEDTEITANPSTEYTGDVVTFTANALDAITGVTADIDPVQNLNGYSNPWPAGGGKNLLNPNTVTNDSWINTTTGAVETGHTGYVVSDYIPVVTGESYTKSGYGNSNRAFTYASDKTPLSRWNANTITVSGDVAFVRLTVQETVLTTSAMVEKNSIATDYAPYSNICPISGHTECKVTRTGKNLFDENGATWVNGKYINPSGNEAGNSNYRYTSNYTKVKPSTEYTLQMNKVTPSSLALTVCEYDINKTFLLRSTIISATSSTGVKSGTFTTSSNTRFIRINAPYNSSDTTYYGSYDFMLEYGSTATTYESYAGQTHTIPLGDTIYGGTLDVTTGVLTVKWSMADLGSLSWQMGSNSGYGQFFYSSISGKATGTTNVLSDRYETKARGDWTADTDYAIAGNSGTSQIYIKDSRYSSASDFKTAMSGIYVCYPLATPTTVQLTPTEVEAILNSQNNVWADTGDVTVEVTSGTLFNNPSPFNAKPLIRVYGIGTFRINDNVVTIASHDKPYIDIDCELQECYYEGDNMSAYVSFSENDYPVLVPDDNYVLMVGVTKLDVTPRWWIL